MRARILDKRRTPKMKILDTKTANIRGWGKSLKRNLITTDITIQNKGLCATV